MKANFMIIGRKHLWSALDVGYVVTAAFIVFLLMMTTMLTTVLAAGGTWPLKSFFPKIFGQESEFFGYMVDLLSFGIMFTLTSNLVLL